MSERSIIFRKVGSFYQTFDDDALIISYLFNYKVINYKCGFPINAIDKITTKLEENTINYIIKQEVEVIKNYQDKNNYDKYLEKSKEKLNNSKIIEQINEKLINLNEKQLKEILESLEKGN